MSTPKQRWLVTAALPYANGRLHVGHIAGAYLPADIFVRFLRLYGCEAHFVCGSDENGAPITFSAMKDGSTPQDIIDRYHTLNARTFQAMGIDFSIYGRTHCRLHEQVSQEFFLRLHEKGHVQKRTSTQVYCTVCDMFLPDRYVEGICHWDDCAKAGARGDQCEACGRPIDATRLGEPECMVCRMQKRPSRGHIEVRETTHWYLRLDTFTQDLRAFLDRHPEWRETVKRFSYGLLDQGLRERAITRDMQWGVPVPLPEAGNKVLYVWFDAPIGYITFTRELFRKRGRPEAWKDFWHDESTALVHFIGKDNTVFHAVMFPGMLMAHGQYRLPDAVVANEFLNLESDKISTSRDYAVWVEEYLQAFAPDPLRYYLTAIAPEMSDSNFSWSEFQAHNNGELADNIGNFIQRNLGFCAKYFQGEVPPAGPPTRARETMLAEIEAARREMAELLLGYRFKAALERLMKLAQAGNRFFAEEEPWRSRKTDMRACGATLHVGMQVVEALSVLMAPFMPFAATRLRALLRLDAPKPGAWKTGGGIAAGHRLDKPQVLFPKLDDETVRQHVESLGRGHG